MKFDVLFATLGGIVILISLLFYAQGLTQTGDYLTIIGLLTVLFGFILENRKEITEIKRKKK